MKTRILNIPLILFVALLVVTVTLASTTTALQASTDAKASHPSLLQPIVTPGVETELYSSELAFVVTPKTVRAGAQAATTTVSLAVSNAGTVGSPAVDVQVDFYQGQPGPGALWLGRGTLSALSPNSTALTSSVVWQPKGAGQYTLYAVIDPNFLIDEVDETNNTISRLVTVLPNLGDSVPPVINSFSINYGAYSTYESQVYLNTSASDPNPRSGIDRLFFIEYVFSQVKDDWDPVALSGWLPYDTAYYDYSWSLQPVPGVHYIQVWAADRAGNISAAVLQMINYYPSPSYVIAREVHIYRQLLTAGHTYAVRLTYDAYLYLDADIYIWDPNGWSIGIGDSLSSPEEIIFTAKNTDVYQFEVEGETGADYSLGIIDQGVYLPQPKNSSASRPWKGRSEFLIAPRDTPTEDVGLPSASVTMPQLFLPLTFLGRQ